MFKGKGTLVVGSVLGIFLLVYGTAVVFRLLMGSYFLNEGLTDPNYILLALLCAIPFGVGSSMGKNKTTKKHFETIFMGGVLFTLLFTTVHGVLVFWAPEMTNEVIVRTLTVFPISALFVVLAVNIGMKMKRPARES